MAGAHGNVYLIELSCVRIGGRELAARQLSGAENVFGNFGIEREATAALM